MTTPQAAVYIRTRSGQAEVVSGELPLSRSALRLLLLVNGFTPLHALAGRLYPGDDAGVARDVLLSFGLIAEAAAANPRSVAPDLA